MIALGVVLAVAIVVFGNRSAALAQAPSCPAGFSPRFTVQVQANLTWACGPGQLDAVAAKP